MSREPNRARCEAGPYRPQADLVEGMRGGMIAWGRGHCGLEADSEVMIVSVPGTSL